MAKPKATKLQNFFEGHRRKAFLVAWSHLRTKAKKSGPAELKAFHEKQVN